MTGKTIIEAEGGKEQTPKGSSKLVKRRLVRLFYPPLVWKRRREYLCRGRELTGAWNNRK